MSAPSLAEGMPAARAQQRLMQAATEAVAKTHAQDLDLDDSRGSAVAFEAVADLAFELPLAGQGSTLARWSALAAVAAVDVTLGRLLEAHADAISICAELGAPTHPGQLWGVWAAEGPEATVHARRSGHGWQLTGAKPWCSGASMCTDALVTADSPDGRALFAVALDPATAHPDATTWQAIGLSGSATTRVDFRGAPATRVGEPGAYLTRPGFWHGATGVAAVWWGGARGIAGALYDRAEGLTEPHALAHLGAIEAALAASAALLREAAAGIDADPQRQRERAALTARAAVEESAELVVSRVGRALGPAPLCQDRALARRLADLPIYLRQSHAERDLARIGELVGAAPEGP